MISRNLKAICDNKYQGTAKKVLTVCSAGCLRSPSAAIVLHEEYGYNTRSCGIEVDYAIVPISETLLYWADEIVCMMAWMADEVEQMLVGYGLMRPTFALGIEDDYSYMQPELVELIKQRYKEVTDCEHE